MLNLAWTLRRLVEFTLSQNSNSSYFLLVNNLSFQNNTQSRSIRSLSNESNSTKVSNENDQSLSNIYKHSLAYKFFILLLIVAVLAAVSFLVINKNLFV